VHASDGDGDVSALEGVAGACPEFADDRLGVLNGVE
jgi:hypothetical protein